MSAQRTVLRRPTATDGHRTVRGHRRRGRACAAVAAWTIALAFVTPIVWMLLTSLHSEVDAAKNPPDPFAPLTLDGYIAFIGAHTGRPAWPALANSAIASVGSTLAVLILALPAAYALSVKPVRKWSDVMFFLLSTKFLPVVAGLLPLYMVALKTGLLGSIGWIGVLYTAMNLPIAIWLLRSFLAEIPREILEAANLDGAGIFRVLRDIVLPIAVPGIASTGLICFIFAWNELLLARTMAGASTVTAPVFLTGFVTSQGLFLAQLSAACLAISLPVLVAGFAAQDKLVQGLSMGAVK
jgi:sorbitol/mannitol transport system permease protein